MVQREEKKKNEKEESVIFALGKVNYVLIAIGVAVVVVGLLLMSGGGTTESAYDPDIFSARRIKVAPLVCLVGFVSMIVSILYKPRR